MSSVPELRGAALGDRLPEAENEKGTPLKRASSERRSEMPEDAVTLSRTLDREAGFRRSVRGTIHVPVRIETTGPDGEPASEETVTSVVNPHGALVRLSMKVMTGQLVSVLNLTTGEVAVCRVVFVEEGQPGKRGVGIEFTRPTNRFWRTGPQPSNETQAGR